MIQRAGDGPVLEVVVGDQEVLLGRDPLNPEGETRGIGEGVAPGGCNAQGRAGLREVVTVGGQVVNV